MQHFCDTILNGTDARAKDALHALIATNPAASKSVDVHGSSLLAVAARSGRVNLVRELALQCSVDELKWMLSRQDDAGETALHECGRLSAEEAQACLSVLPIEAAHLQLVNALGLSPLDVALVAGSPVHAVFTDALASAARRDRVPNSSIALVFLVTASLTLPLLRFMMYDMGWW